LYPHFLSILVEVEDEKEEMMRKGKIVLLLFAAAVLSINNVSAARIDGLSGVVVEGPNVILPTGYTADFTIGDTSGLAGDPILTVDGETRLFGRVYDCCVDAFTIENLANQIFDLTISALGGSSGFELGVELNGGALYNGVITDTFTTLFFGDVSSSTNFAFTGNHGNTRYLIDITDLRVSQVPLPPSLYLLSSALGGLILMRRRKKRTET
jgi:hypothetical protein